MKVNIDCIIMNESVLICFSENVDVVFCVYFPVKNCLITRSLVQILRLLKPWSSSQTEVLVITQSVRYSTVSHVASLALLSG